MSQRLCVGEPGKPDYYDCVIRENKDVGQKLKDDWLMMGENVYFGPWKIMIKDMALFLEIEPTIKKVFDSVGEVYPDCIWIFHAGGRMLANRGDL